MPYDFTERSQKIHQLPPRRASYGPLLAFLAVLAAGVVGAWVAL